MTHATRRDPANWHKDSAISRKLQQAGRLLLAVQQMPIADRLAMLIAEAEAAKQIITVTLEPSLPLAMGHYRMVGAVRPARELATPTKPTP